MKRNSGIIILCFFISSCTWTKPVVIPQQKFYRLSQTPLSTHVNFDRLSLEKTTVADLYNSPRIFYTEKKYSVNYYNYNTWITTPSLMFDELLKKTFDLDSQKTADYRLQVHVNKMEINYIHNPKVDLNVIVRLLDGKSEHAIYKKNIHIEEEFKSRTPYAAVVAINQAVSKLLKTIRNQYLNSQ